MQIIVLRPCVSALLGLLILKLTLNVHACDEDLLERTCRANHPGTYPKCEIDSCEPCSGICWREQETCSYWISRQFCLLFNKFPPSFLMAIKIRQLVMAVSTVSRTAQRTIQSVHKVRTSQL